MTHLETELSDTRRQFHAELDSMSRQIADLSEKLYALKGEISDKDAEIAELKATISRRERMGLDNHPEASV